MNHKSAAEIWVIYNAGDSKIDPRIGARTVSQFAAANKEICYMLKRDLHGAKRRGVILPRTSFNKCGESSTHDATYPGVEHRHLQQIPRLSDADIENILGPKALLAAACANTHVKDRHVDEVSKRGNPLFWGEYKPVDLLKEIFIHCDFTEVWDLTPGSGAAASAALSLGIKYEGLCVNEGQQQWLDVLMDKVVFAVAVESNDAAAAIGASAAHVASIKMFFHGTVKEAKRYLVNVEKGDAPPNKDDEEEEDVDNNDSDEESDE